MGSQYPQAQVTPADSQLRIQDFDYLWSEIKNKYAYFGKRKTDWNKVRVIYRPKVEKISNISEFVTLLERVLDELYDPHTHLKTNTSRSTRLIPTGLDVWAEWVDRRPVITQLRPGFSAEQAGLRVGMEIISINSVPIETALRDRLGCCLSSFDRNARDWALRALLAGTRDRPRSIEVKDITGVRAIYQLDLSQHTTADSDNAKRGIEFMILEGNLGYIKINDLGSNQTVSDFDVALEEMKNAAGLIIDLRATQSGGNTSVAEPIMGRLIGREMAYQKGLPKRGKGWIRRVSARGPWTFKKPVIVLVSRWTASMGEGIAIGLDGMKRATVVGTRMAGLNGSVFDFVLPNSKIRVNYAAERLFHIDGTPREDFVPPVFVNISGQDSDDAILTAGIKTLKLTLGRTR